MIDEMIKTAGRKVVKFCVKNACFILPYPEPQTRARLLKNSALLIYVLVLLFFQLYLYQASPRILGFATNIVTDELYQLVNQERANLGLPALARNSKLEQAAFNKAQDMIAKNYWAHYAPDGSTTPWQFILDSGYTYNYAGENLAKDFDTSAAVVAAWMASASHRANIVNTNYKDIGMVAVNGSILGAETTLVVQMLGSTATAAAAPLSGSAPQPAGGTAGASAPAVPEPQPLAVIGPTEEGGEPSAAPEAQAKLAPVEQIVRAFNPTASPKTLPLGFGFLLLGLFAVDEFYMLKGGLNRQELKRTAENLGHMVILGVLMVVVWMTRTGGIL
uniref:SCP domain-containing protein n=1 Tax=candidate division WWE3 bacterium TaxID=2053526 RepID=A0A832E0X5_UNCKA